MTHELNPNVQFRGLVSDMSDVVDEAILGMLESTHPDDRVLASLAEARGGVVRMQHALKVVTIHVVGDQPRTYADELPPGVRPKSLDLPKLQKQPKGKNKNVQRPGISKLKKGAIEFACPTCGAEPDTPCFVMTGPGHNSQVTEVRRTDGWKHEARVKLATAHNRKVIAKYDREHFTQEAQS